MGTEKATSELAVERSMLEAILDGDADAWTTTSSSIEGERAFRVLTTAMSAAVFRRWHDDPSLAEVSNYVAEMSASIPGEMPVPPALVEALIRGSLGETQLLKGIPSKDVVLGALLIIQFIQKDVLAASVDREAYIVEVLDAVD
jgi:hypothetical protein